MVRNPSAKPGTRQRAMDYFHCNKLDKARGLFRQFCKQDPRDAEAWLYLGNINGRLGRPEEAEACLRQVVSLRPDNAQAHYLLGTAFREQGRLEEAAASYQRSLQIHSGHAEGHNNLGVTLHALNRLPEAEASYRCALQLRPDYAVAYRNLAITLKSQGRIDEARAGLEQAIRLDPRQTDAYDSLGCLYYEQNDFEQAEAVYRNALQNNSRYADGYRGLARVFQAQANYQAAFDNLQKALAIEPDLAEAQWRLALLTLLHGDFANGWCGYEWRWKTEGIRMRNFPQPRWDGSPLAGRTILVHGEQGIGDEIMFTSCVPELLMQADRVILECEPRLAPLFQRSFPAAVVRGDEQRDDLDWLHGLGRIDVQVPMGSLPLYLRPSLASFPQHSGYLQADSVARRRWQERFRTLGEGLCVGISWTGGTTDIERKNRSVPLREWEPLLRSCPAHFINIQYGDHCSEIQEVSAELGVPIHDWPEMDATRDLDGFAAMLAALDLVISIDNSTAHLAGALNVPVWICLPRVPNWRWMLDTDESPWYPGMRLFRAQERGVWSGPVEEMAAELRDLAKPA